MSIVYVSGCRVIRRVRACSTRQVVMVLYMNITVDMLCVRECQGSCVRNTNNIQYVPVSISQQGCKLYEIHQIKTVQVPVPHMNTITH